MLFLALNNFLLELSTNFSLKKQKFVFLKPIKFIRNQFIILVFKKIIIRNKTNKISVFEANTVK